MNNKRLYEILRYGLVGVSTTVVNLAIYHLLILVGIDYRISNLFAVVLCKVYGYFANKLIVFGSHCSSLKELLYEIGKFVVARGISGIIDYFGVILAVEVFGIDKIVSKYAINIIVIVVNYLFGKYLVFTKTEDKS